MSTAIAVHKDTKMTRSEPTTRAPHGLAKQCRRGLVVRPHGYTGSMRHVFPRLERAVPQGCRRTDAADYKGRWSLRPVLDADCCKSRTLLDVRGLRKAT